MTTRPLITILLLTVIGFWVLYGPRSRWTTRFGSGPDKGLAGHHPDHAVGWPAGAWCVC